MFTKPWMLPTRHVMLNTGDPKTYGNTIIPSIRNTNDYAHWVVNDNYVREAKPLAKNKRATDFSVALGPFAVLACALC